MESNTLSPSMERFGSRRIEEAHAELKKANKALKTSLFKWSADYDVASRAFEAAASRYNMAGMLVEAKDCFVNSAECKMKSEHPSAYFAAKHLESAAGCSQRLSDEVEDVEQKVGLIDEAAPVSYTHLTLPTKRIV
eukprot:TRINITY_DN12302_c0_g1_i7.p1 TRINITY_DN12302_c0_g1~~TRINITY_DN12302_c0_g1_i7.p1  ORF type:complete len:136 (-),score=30.45 TRINITY_DN12302_c0_g1_i7:108-515(-)